jgi:hypothetical protein
MSASEFVRLSNGAYVPIVALRMLWRLENNGLSFRLDGEDLIVNPRGLFSDRDRLLVKEHKPDIVAIVRYCEELRA